MVELSMANAPDGPRLMIFPSIATPGLPAEMVVPAIENDEGLGLKLWPPIVKSLLGGVSDRLGRETVLLPITRVPF